MIERDISIAPVVGWRVWTPTWWNDGSGMVPRLLSAGNTIWPVDGWLKAKCLEEKSQHAAPQTFCTCGIYARKERREVQEAMFYGEVELGGLVVEAEHGYVASHGFPKKLYVAKGSNCKGKRVNQDNGYLVFRIGNESVCSCIGQPPTALVETLAAEYGIEVEFTNELKCPCDKHCKEKNKDERGRAEEVYRNAAAPAGTSYTLAIGSTTENTAAPASTAKRASKAPAVMFASSAVAFAAAATVCAAIDLAAPAVICGATSLVQAAFAVVNWQIYRWRKEFP